MSLLLLPQLRERLSYARHIRAYLIILGGWGPVPWDSWVVKQQRVVALAGC